MDGISLSALVDENLEAARSSSSARSARTIHGGHDRSLRETVIALLSGHELAEHESPGEATVGIRPGGRTEGHRICFVRDPDGYRVELIGA